MTPKATQWLALAMLLSTALGALAAKQENAPAKPADSPVEASVAAKHKDNYHPKNNYHHDDYKGSEYYPKGGEYYPKDGDYYPKGGDYYPKGGDYYPKGGDYYPQDADYYPTVYAPEQYPHDYYGNDEYPHDEYPSDYHGDHYSPKGSYSTHAGKSLWIPTPAQSQGTMTMMTCPAVTTGAFGTCKIVCPSANNGVYPFGCFWESDGPYATVTCPRGTRAADCDCDCKDDGLLALCIKTNIGGYRKTCLSGCNVNTIVTSNPAGTIPPGKAQVRATCEPIPHGHGY